ncbi:UDP-N-acetylmuramoyl-tripeptide--D-alanyl-D-alanine ligase [Kushneria phosphatilytica]|uniref:UDP-N-acetylmuramoyl-tripeptide--D-alanyl-D-alanine ligase n=2 Tax=Kushneria phosphatilytica TaxID=657387 RepID=A0A1S1NT02_9GAMM|nr:UDP-N-acetylmuramoyl-tripeptide--D-alanyl-D-alanine ligase [Kushneria phosphatilytica]QEL12820.1 UDP-N-acetylmuramoyl-tripeptide--D-alanyl-D-alanine ligase [Kushneria phosphatilytica]
MDNDTGLNTLAEVATALGADVPDGAGEQVIERIITDTRQLDRGDLFLALRGERFDGHAFLQTAFERGASAAIVDRRDDHISDLPQLVVPDTRLALGMLGAARRRHWGRELVAITGNSGKTTVRALTGAILQLAGATHMTRANLNNDIGVPLTLLELKSCHQRAVLELGANHSGEIAWTTALTRPDVAVITNVTGAHVGEFGGLGYIAQAKGEILAGLGTRGVAVLNRDDRFFPIWQQLAGEATIIDFGFDDRARVYASDMACDALGRYAFTLFIDGQDCGRIQLTLMGRHNVLNALAAAAVAHALGIDPILMQQGLESAEAVNRRMVVVPGPHNSRLVDDSYNANPGAVRAALEALTDLPGPRWCLLGAMGELGDYSESAHREIGEHARALGIDVMGTVGEPARAACEAFGEGGHHFEQWSTLAEFVRERLPEGASVLIKGSLSAGMDRLVSALRTDIIR